MAVLGWMERSSAEASMFRAEAAVKAAQGFKRQEFGHAFAKHPV